MGITHPYTASSGELITSARWNADHVVTGASTMQTITWIAYPDGLDVVCTDADTWYEIPRAAITIPGDQFLGMNTGDLSIHWKCTDTPASLAVRIYNGTNSIGTATQSHSGGSYYTTLGEDLGITGWWPSGNSTFTVWVKSSTGTNTISVYSVVGFFRV